MDLTTITVSDFKARFPNDFPYHDIFETETEFDDAIGRSFDEAQMNFNQALFGTDAEITLAYLYLTAHYFVMDVQKSSQGVNSVGTNPMNSRSVGSVSESYSIPQRFLDDPILGYYAKTQYGQKYLSFVIPRITGNVFVVEGKSRP